MSAHYVTSLDAARALEPSWRGELEITEAIQGLIDDGHRLQSAVVKAWRKDPEHLEAQRRGREEFYDRFNIQVLKVLRDYEYETPRPAAKT